MSYLNVDKPKFFVNELQYQNSLNNLKVGIWLRGKPNVGGAYQDWNDWWPDSSEHYLPYFNHPEKPFEGLNIDCSPEGWSGDGNNRCYFVFSLVDGYWNDVLLNEDSGGLDKYGSWLGLFGHRYYDKHLIILASPQGWQTENEPFGWDPSFMPSSNESFPNAGNISMSTIMNSYLSYNGIWIDVEGWSMAAGVGSNLCENAKSIVISFIPVGQPLGCVGIGNYYQPNIGPNMGYNMGHAYDGAKFITTKGGSTFSNTSYSGPPSWASGGAAWELGYVNELDEYQSPSNLRRSSRRTYGFSWKGLSDSYLMPSNTLQSIYKHGTFQYESNDVNNVDFYTQVLKKTLDNSFIFAPDGDNLTAESFMFARWDSPSLNFKQISHKIYQFSKTIVESW